MTYLMPIGDLWGYKPTHKSTVGSAVPVSTALSNDERDLLSFMEEFTFPNLGDVEQSLTDTGEYTKTEIAEIVSGLKTLPEYNRD